MTKKPNPRSFRWTPETEALAELMAAIGASYLQIARHLNCRVSTVRRQLGNVSDLPAYSLQHVLALYDAYDTARNITELISADGGSAEQARLRASLRASRSRLAGTEQSEFEDRDEQLSDEQVCADLERLVGRPIGIKLSD
ncbi:MAG: hypothetical protein AAFY82_07050 [Pseudomonadota bacterium]